MDREDLMTRMPSAVGLSHRQIWVMFRDIYLAKGLREDELRRIHDHWVAVSAQVTGGTR